MSILALCVIGGVGAALFIERQLLSNRDNCVKYTVSSDLILWLRDHADELVDDGVARRNVKRARIICNALEIGHGIVAFAVSLPSSIGTEVSVDIPHEVRQAISMRHARWDGGGVSPIKGNKIPIASQVLSVIDWFDVRDYSSIDRLTDEFLSERGKRFSPEIVDSVVYCIADIIDVERSVPQSNFRVTNGAIVVCTPKHIDDEPCELLTHATAAAIRRTIRPRDHIRISNGEIIMWLRDVDSVGVEAVLRRITSTLESTMIQENVDRFVFGAAMAGVDSNKFADLMSVARSRVKSNTTCNTVAV